MAEVDAKCDAALALAAASRSGALSRHRDCSPADPACVAGRPAHPVLVQPADLPSRSVGSREGHAALLHAIAHIEFNAIDLALDCAYRFRGLPDAFYAGWLDVAGEEASHFRLVRERLRALGFDYGSFPAHDGLWEMARKTAHDPLARMALVPRLLEARGLDATPPIMRKLERLGDRESLDVLEVILRDEVGHVALGDRWFRHFCQQHGLEPEAAYLSFIEAFDAPRPRPPLHREARLAAGFSAAELEAFETGRGSGRDV